MKNKDLVKRDDVIKLINIIVNMNWINLDIINKVTLSKIDDPERQLFSILNKSLMEAVNSL